MNKILSIVVLLVLIIAGVWWWQGSDSDSALLPTDYKAATYTVEGMPVTLDGSTTKFFGNEAKGDLNADGIPDQAFVLTHQPGGSGTFYYVVAAIQGADNTYTGTHAVLLGDRIAPQSTEIRDGKLIVNYADRASGEPMTSAPSVGKTLVLKLDPATMQWGEVVQDFEGEADPNTMSLQMKKWVWSEGEAFTLSFDRDANFAATTDCNSMSGQFTTGGDSLTFSNIAMTKMYCEDSREADFAKILENSKAYSFTNRGELVLELKVGTATFK